MRNNSLQDQRNNSIKKRYTYHRKRNAKWTIVAIIEQVGFEFYLSPATITKILKQQDVDVPAVNTIVKYTQCAMLR